MVYTSTSLSLAMIEVFVHLRKDQIPDDLVSIEADIPIDETKIEQDKTFTLLRLPTDWKSEGNTELQGIGDEWITSSASLHLFVPSVPVKGEWNILLNPAHPDANRIRQLAMEPLHFDERMFT